MKLFEWHFMPYPELPEDMEQNYDSAWITLPNQLFDPSKGVQLYSEYIQQLVMAEELGLDGVVVNEHHQNAYGMMPSPNLIASALTQLTSKIQIVVLGNLLYFYHRPTRVAEEIAMLDVMSNGRIISGMAVGMAAEFYSYNNNPMFVREQFWESVDVIMKAFTKPGPFSYKGKHFTLPYVNIWPRPVQQPRPQIWVPGAVSSETMIEVARRGLGYFLSSRLGIKGNKEAIGRFRGVLEKEGSTYSPYRMGLLVTVYIGETDEEAREECGEHVWFFLRKHLYGHLSRRGRSLTVIPYNTLPPSYRAWFAHQNWNEGMLGDAETWDDIKRFGSIIIGSPETVANYLVELVRECEVGNLLIQFQFGDMPHEKAVRNIKMFSERVMPILREEGDKALRKAFGMDPENITWQEVRS